MKNLPIIMLCIAFQISFQSFGQKFPELEPLRQALLKIESAEYDVLKKYGVPYDELNYENNKRHTKFLNRKDSLPLAIINRMNSDAYYDGFYSLVIDHESKTAEYDTVYKNISVYFIHPTEFQKLERLFKIIDTIKTEVKTYVKQINSNQTEYSVTIIPNIRIHLAFIGDVLVENVKGDAPISFTIVTEKDSNLPKNVTILSEKKISILEFKNLKTNHLTNADFILPKPPKRYKKQINNSIW